MLHVLVIGYFDSFGCVECMFEREGLCVFVLIEVFVLCYWMCGLCVRVLFLE